MIQTSIALEALSIVITFILLIYNLFERKNNKKQTIILRTLLLSTIIVLVADILIWSYDGQEWFVRGSYFLNIITFLFGYIITTLYTFYVINFIKTKRPISRCLSCFTSLFCIICCILVFVSLFDNWYFYIDDTFHYQRAEYFWMSQLLGILEFTIVVVLVIRYHKVLGFKDSLFLLSYAIFPIIGVVIQIFYQDVALFYVGTTLAILIIYLSIHIEEEKHIQKTEADLLEANFKIMISQIQPHFLFNALTCIIDLCDTNPKVAKDTTIFFAHYLRNNLEAINNSNQITFEQELKHIKNYLELEKVRFEGLNANYEINASGFPIPILSIQPLVENAVKYGIGKNGNKGTVTIKTEQDSKYYYVYVIDDGAGFDVNNYKADTSRSHIGIDNCRDRIVKQANGLFEINSEVGKGTTIKISIPKIY